MFSNLQLNITENHLNNEIKTSMIRLKLAVCTYSCLTENYSF